MCNKRSLRVLLSLALLVSSCFAETEVVEVGVVPIRVAGELRPLEDSEATAVLLRALEESAPRARFRLIDAPSGLSLESALERARSAGVEIIVWGQVRYSLGEEPSRELYNRHQIKLHLVAEGDLKVAWVGGRKMILSQPTWVTSARQTRGLVSGGRRNLRDLKEMAESSLEEIAESVVRVVKTRHQAGWFLES